MSGVWTQAPAHPLRQYLAHLQLRGVLVLRPRTRQEQKILPHCNVNDGLNARTTGFGWRYEVDKSAGNHVQGSSFSARSHRIDEVCARRYRNDASGRRRTSAMQAQIASHILAYAAKRERDPIALRTAALSAIVDSTHYSHDVSSERRVV